MRLLALALLICAGAASAQQLPGAVVWIPPENFSRWNEVDALLRAHDGVKLTIGVTPAMATPPAKATLMPWIAQGRIELAARIDGDPALTLIAGHPAAPRPQDALERAVETRELLKKRLEQAPAGFLPGAGALDAAVAASLGAGGAGWILAGPYTAPDAPWAASRAVFVPSNAVKLYDESADTDSVFLNAAASLPRPVAGWATVGELAREKSAVSIELSAVAAWPAWDPSAAKVPPAGAGAAAAWDAYGAAARALDRYQNSGSADLRTLDAAVELLRRAQAARFYRPSATTQGLSPELRAALLAVYKKLRVPAPDALYDASSDAAAASSADERPTGVRALSGPSWLEFRAPLGSLAADPSRIQSLRAQWDEAAVRLILHVSSASDAAPRPLYEIYTDFNHVLGAGRVPLLEGRGAVVPARDAWELALSIVGDEARLYRARGGGEPEETATFKAQWSLELGGPPPYREIVVLVPRSYMRGNPARWGWAVVALAEDPAHPGRRPAAALVGPDGRILLDALAPADRQKAILSRANSRVPAARLEP